MNSPFANLFLAIQQHVKDGLPTVKYIDQDLGQLKATGRPPVSWPCVLIDFEDFAYQNLGNNVQTATGTVVLRLGFAPFSGTSQVTPTPYLQQAISYYDIEWALHKLIQGWTPSSDMGHMIRTSTTTQKRTDNYRVRELRYSIAFEDYSTKPQQQLAPATLVVEEQIVV